MHAAHVSKPAVAGPLRSTPWRVVLAATVATGLSLAAVPAAVAAPPTGVGAVDAAEVQRFDPGRPTVWQPQAVNRRPVGGPPAGRFAPTSVQDSSLAGSTSTSPSALAAANPTALFTGPGAAGANGGVQPFYGVENFALAPRVTATVNLATGNLVLRSQDVAFNAPGLSLQLDSFHNSRATGTGSLGVGAVLTTGQDIGLQFEGSRVVFYGPSGFTAAFTSNAAGGWTAPAGINADLVKNAGGSWSLTYRKTGEKLSFTGGGFLVFDVDRNGVGLTLGYDASDKVVSITDGAGRVTTFAYQAQGNISQITDPTGRVTDYDYDNNNVNPADNTNTINVVRYPDGTDLGLTADAAGRVQQLRTRSGNKVAFGYDSTGRVIRIDRYLTGGATTGAAATSTFGYPSATSTTQTNPLGGTSTYTLDALGRVTKVVDPLGRSRSATWTPNSDIATATDAMGSATVAGNKITYSYDTLANRTAVALPTGAATRAAYASGTTCSTTDTGHPYQAKCTSDDAGRTRSLTYDGPGNLTSTTDSTAGGGATRQSFTYQSATTTGVQCGGKPGQVCTVTDGRGLVTANTYDTAGNLTRTTPPAPLGATSYAYDTASRLTAVTDGLGQITRYAYDSADRLSSTTYDSGTQTTNFYGPDGNLIRVTDTAKGDSTYRYDTLGREVSRLQPGMTTAFTTGYDNAGNVTAAYDPQGTVVYTYDTASQLTRLTEPGGFVTTFGYDANGNESSRTLPNTVVKTTTRDASGRPLRLRAVNGAGSVLSDLSYSYAAAGSTGTAADRTLVQARTDQLGVGGPAGSRTSYSYDSLGRLTQAAEKTGAGAANATWSYGYDKAGNRLSQTRSGATGPGATAATPAATSSWAYNNANQVISRNASTTGWSHDANGNQLSSPDWGTARYGVRSSVRDITSSAGTLTSFEYLGGGNTTRLEAGSTTYRNGSLGLSGETTAATPLSYRYTPDGKIVSMANAGTRRYFLTDNLGSVVATTDNAGALTSSYSYDPYGNTRTATGTAAADNPLRFTGGYLDRTGLYKLGARYYDPATGRFTQPDPTGQDPHYTYARNNPCNNTDPSGTATVGQITGGCIAGALFGAALGGLPGAIAGCGTVVLAAGIEIAIDGF